MGNSWGGRRTAKVMKLDGETMKFKLPITVKDVVKDYPEHVLMDSEAVRHMGVRAKALDEQQELKSRRLYFLVQLPKVDDHRVPRRARSGLINVSAKERLEGLMLSRRSVSDLTLVKAASTASSSGTAAPSGVVQMKMRLPKAVVAKVMEESKDSQEAAQKIMALAASWNGEKTAAGAGAAAAASQSGLLPVPELPQGGLRPVPEDGNLERRCKPRQKGVRFLPVQVGEMV